MNMTSLIFLLLPCTSICYDSETVWANWMPCGIAVLMDGGWTLRSSFALLPTVVPDSPMYCLGQFMWGHVNLYIMPLFYSLWS